MAFLRERGYSCDTVVESAPLGTGGALRFAAADLPGPHLVLNGDIIGDFDFPSILTSYVPGHALMVAHWREDTADFGLLDVRDGRIREFRARPAVPEPGFINAGCYILEREHIGRLPDGFSMLEHDLFPVLAREGRLVLHEHQGEWEDLGTEMRLRRTRERLGAS